MAFLVLVPAFDEVLVAVFAEVDFVAVDFATGALFADDFVTGVLALGTGRRTGVAFVAALFLPALEADWAKAAVVRPVGQSAAIKADTKHKRISVTRFLQPSSAA